MVQLLELVATRTGHVTMRQLVGFVAYLITGGQSATDRCAPARTRSASSYSNLAFKGGVGALFDAVRAVFDPAEITHPDWDDRLWLGDTDARDWLGKPPPGPMTLNESERNAAYQAIKRRFFFEHKDGTDLLALVPTDEQEFQETLRSGEEATAAVVRDWCWPSTASSSPTAPTRTRITSSSGRAIDMTCGRRRRSSRSMRSRTSTCASNHSRRRHGSRHGCPPEQVDRRSFALVATWENSDVAVVEIDRELFLTLIEAERGLGRSSWSRTATRRITRFIDRIHGSVEQESPIEDIRIRNVESDQC